MPIQKNTNDTFLISKHLSSLLVTSIFSTDVFGILNRLNLEHITEKLSLSWGRTANLTGVQRSHGKLYLEIPLGNFSFAINGQHISDTKTPLHIILTRRNKLTYFSVKEAYKSIRIAVDSTHFAYLYEKNLGREIDIEQCSSFLEFKSEEIKAEFCKKIQPFTSSLQSMPKDQEELEHIANDIIISLIQALSTRRVHPERSYCNTLALRAHELILKLPNEKLSIPQVCKLLNASSRSLQQGFKEVYGMGFIEYHKLFRINRLRDHIRKNGQKSGSLTDLMGMFGFTHAGRFSQEYKKVFGILPSHEEKQITDTSLLL